MPLVITCSGRPDCCGFPRCLGWRKDCCSPVCFGNSWLKRSDSPKTRRSSCRFAGTQFARWPGSRCLGRLAAPVGCSGSRWRRTDAEPDLPAHWPARSERCSADLPGSPALWIAAVIGWLAPWTGAATNSAGSSPGADSRNPVVGLAYALHGRSGPPNIRCTWRRHASHTVHDSSCCWLLPR